MLIQKYSKIAADDIVKKKNATGLRKLLVDEINILNQLKKQVFFYFLKF